LISIIEWSKFQFDRFFFKELSEAQVQVPIEIFVLLAGAEVQYAVFAIKA
jgi:hypothetical protein